MAGWKGRFVWYELMTTDVEAAKAWYAEVVGWGTKDWESGDYTMFVWGEQPMGGVLTLPEEAKSTGAPPHWHGYVAVPDLEETLEQVKALGGRVLSPIIEMPEVGRWAVISDPQGGVVSAFTSPEAPGDDAPAAEMGMPAWHELMTTDMEAAWSFYEALFGWSKVDEMDMGDGWLYRMWGEGAPVGGMCNLPPDQQRPPSWLYYVRVPDLEASVERAQKTGGTLVNGPMDVPGGDRIAQLKDPQGAAFALYWKNEAK